MDPPGRLQGFPGRWLEKVGEDMTKNEVKVRLERYTGLRLEVRLRLERLATLQQMDRERPSPCGSRSEEYAREIAPIVQANRREMAEIEAAVAALPDPLEREVLRLRYMEAPRDPQTGREKAGHLTWGEIAYLTQGRSDGAAYYRAKRVLDKAVSNLATIWPESGQ